MKVGGRLYCWNNIYDDGIELKLVIGNIYIINDMQVTESFGLMFRIEDMNNDYDYYSVNDNVWYYRNWFYTERELRMMKLKKLKQISYEEV